MPALCRLIAACVVLAIAMPATAQQTVSIAGGRLQFKAPANWTKKQPGSTMIEHEFAIPAVEGDKNDGRLTIMAAGGGAQANIDRWISQFSQPGGGNTRDKTKIEKTSVAGQEVHIVDISGTYKDQAGPMAPAVERPDYRMLAAIIATSNAGDQFIKFYGPAKTVAANQKAFADMIRGMTKK